MDGAFAAFEAGVDLLGDPLVAAYLQELQQTLSSASSKQHLAGLRHWMDWLTERGVLTVNPAASVRGPRHVVHEVKTPVLERDEARRLLASIDGADVVSLRDKALLSVRLFSFARVGAGVKMRVRDFEDEASDAWLVLVIHGAHSQRAHTRGVRPSFNTSSSFWSS